jgi:hypothetical protein
LEAIRLAFANARSSLSFIRRVWSLRIDDSEPDATGRVVAEVEVDIEGHGTWAGRVSVFVGCEPPMEAHGDFAAAEIV